MLEGTSAVAEHEFPHGDQHEDQRGARRDALLEVFVTFAQHAGGTFEVEPILRELALAAAGVLQVAGAGVSYRLGERLEHVYASCAPVEQAERTQALLQQGPCQQACRSAEVVVQEDLRLDQQRWPAFAQRALQLGLRAVASLPLRARGRVWGALNVYRTSPGPFAAADLAAARVLADVACSYVVMAHDRDAALSAQAASAHAATHDALTGLANRALLYDRLAHALATAERHHSPLALVFLDLDGFKAVNDTLGHHAGDALLVEVARRLAGTVRTGDTLARLGGDEFVIVCENLHAGPGGSAAQESLAALVARVRAALAAPVLIGGQRMTIAASVGIATAGEHTAGVDDLLRAADAAMYQAKRRAKSRAEDRAEDSTGEQHEQATAEAGQRQGGRGAQAAHRFPAAVIDMNAHEVGAHLPSGSARARPEPGTS